MPSPDDIARANEEAAAREHSREARTLLEKLTDDVADLEEQRQKALNDRERHELEEARREREKEKPKPPPESDDERKARLDAAKRDRLEGLRRWIDERKRPELGSDEAKGHRRELEERLTALAAGEPSEERDDEQAAALESLFDLEHQDALEAAPVAHVAGEPNRRGQQLCERCGMLLALVTGAGPPFAVGSTVRSHAGSEVRRRRHAARFGRLLGG